MTHLNQPTETTPRPCTESPSLPGTVHHPKGIMPKHPKRHKEPCIPLTLFQRLDSFFKRMSK